MTKGEFISIVEKRLGGGEVTNDSRARFHPLVVEKNIGIEYGDLLDMVYKISKSENDPSQLDYYIKPFCVPVLFDKKRGEKYSVLPVQPVALPNNDAIRQISPVKGQTQAYLYTENGAQAVFSELEVSIVNTIPTYYVEGQQVRYDDKVTDCDEVLMKLIIPFDKFDKNDEVPMPSGKENIVMDRVVNRLLGIGPQDKVNDQNADK